MGGVERINEREQNIDRYQNVRVDEWITRPGENISVFGGWTEQRNAVVEYIISRYLGNVGVIVLHNNDLLENDLNRFHNYYPEIFKENPDIKACFINGSNSVYEPLEGLDKNRIVEIIYSDNSDEYQKHSQSIEVLKIYLDILKYAGKTMNLDNLLTLCNMHYEQLKQDVLPNLPPSVAENYRAKLARDNQWDKVGEDVRNFAGKLDGRIWSEDLPQTSISMIRAVENKALLTIRMSSDNRILQDYLAAELDYMIERKMNFVLVVDSVIMKDSRLRNIAINLASNFCTVISANSNIELGDSMGKEHNENQLIYKADKVILFQCPDHSIAGYYSALIGNYLKKVVTYHEDKHRGAFDIFSGHGKGKGIAEQDFERIRPEELAGLRDGAVLIDRKAGRIETARRFIC